MEVSSQKLVTDNYSEPDESSMRLQILFLSNSF